MAVTSMPSIVVGRSRGMGQIRCAGRPISLISNVAVTGVQKIVPELKLLARPVSKQQQELLLVEESGRIEDSTRWSRRNLECGKADTSKEGQLVGARSRRTESQWQARLQP